MDAILGVQEIATGRISLVVCHHEIGRQLLESKALARVRGVSGQAAFDLAEYM